MDYKYDAIILNKLNVGEADRIYTFFTKQDGKVRALGKGVRRPNAKLAGNLEPITLIELVVAKGRGMGKVTAAIPAKAFSGIKGNLGSLRQVFYVFEIFNKLITEQEKDEAIFQLLVDYLETLENLRDGDEEKKELLTSGFLVKLLNKLGYKLGVEKCVSCGKKLLPENNRFSMESGGVLCADCAASVGGGIGINSETIKLLRIFLKNNISSLPKVAASARQNRDLKKIIKAAFDWIIG